MTTLTYIPLYLNPTLLNYCLKIKVNVKNKQFGYLPTPSPTVWGHQNNNLPLVHFTENDKPIPFHVCIVKVGTPSSTDYSSSSVLLAFFLTSA